MQNLTVKDLMVKHPVLIGSDATLKDAAIKMESVNCGVLPIGTEKEIEGMITDRDIVIRAIAKGKDPAKEKIKNHMTASAYFCHESDTLKQAAETMKKNRVSRLIVKNSEGDVSGILSFGALLRDEANAEEIADIVLQAASRKKAA